MTEQEIQKQIEAVRGLKRAYKELTMALVDKKGVLIDYMDESLALEMHISALTETLKPYLNGEKLEV